MPHFSLLTVLNGKRLTVSPLIGKHRNTSKGSLFRQKKTLKEWNISAMLPDFLRTCVVRTR